jgi:hypothetical protein
MDSAELRLLMTAFEQDLRKKLPSHIKIVYRREILEIKKDNKSWLFLAFRRDCLVLVSDAFYSEENSLRYGVKTLTWLQRSIVDPEFDPDEVVKTIIAIDRGDVTTGAFPSL